MEVPLHEFKILFNSNIIEKCDPNIIKEYFEKLKSGADTKELFEEIIRVAYGERAANILKSRPQLNVHTINSLEVFDERIIDSFGEAFVHDCISYNIRDFSEFLAVVKNPKEFALFKNYYSILTGVYGKNVETMQKAISEFEYVKDLLINIESQDLTNEQVLNLLNVLCSEKNPLDISTIDELNKYNQIANEKLVQMIGEVDEKRAKEILCQNLLGMDYYMEFECHKRTEKGYGTSLEEVMKLYDISKENEDERGYSDEERRIIEIIRFISSEIDISKIREFVSNYVEQKGIRDFSAVIKLIEKIQDREIEEANKEITTIEKLEEICEQQKESESPLVTKEEIEGVKVFHLKGIPYVVFAHSTGGLIKSIEELLSYEGQGGNSAICSRISTEKMGANQINGRYLYGKLDRRGIITANASDASTIHTAKRTKMRGNITVKVKNIHNIKQADNEVAFYRRKRNHDEVTNENGGGRITPMAYAISSSISREYIENKAKEMKGTGVAIFIMHEEAYKKIELEEKEKNAEKESVCEWK